MHNRYDRDYDGEDSFWGRRDDRDVREQRAFYRDEADSRYGERSERAWRAGDDPERHEAPRQSWARRGPAGSGYAQPRVAAHDRLHDEAPYGGERPRSAYRPPPERYGERGRTSSPYAWEDHYPRHRYSEPHHRAESERPHPSHHSDAREPYQPQVWTRDPSGPGHEGYGYDRSARYGEGSVHFRPDRESSREWRRPNSDTWRRWSPNIEGQRRLASQYGKGPKGYVRSDERIREDVCDRLSDDDEVDASDISVSVKAGEVLLEGTVVDRHCKHRAEDIAESVSGVRDVANRLKTRKSLMHELGDKLTGDDATEHRGHTGSGTKNSPQIGAKTAQSH